MCRFVWVFYISRQLISQYIFWNSRFCHVFEQTIKPVLAYLSICNNSTRSTRQGKETMSSIVHKRFVAVSVPLSVASSDADAFGYSRIAVSHLERLREAEKSAAFEKVVKAAAKKLVKKRQNYKDFVKGRLPTLCAMGVREVRNVRRKISKKRKAFASELNLDCLKYTAQQHMIQLEKKSKQKHLQLALNYN